jgi:hypothetical protein
MSSNRKNDLKNKITEKIRKSCERELNKMVLKDSPIPPGVNMLKLTTKIVYMIIKRSSIEY